MIKWLGGIIGAVIALGGGLAVAWFYMAGLLFPALDETPPQLPDMAGGPAILNFTKVTGFWHKDSQPVATAMLEQLAAQNGWAYAQTGNGAVMNAEQLALFDVVVWNNNAGTVLTGAQKAAFTDWVQQGGGVVMMHAAVGDYQYQWDWYVDHLIGAQFVGHTQSPQFQDAIVEPQDDAITNHLPPRWLVENEEWYGFDRNPEGQGAKALLLLDETSYQPGDEAMGPRHPIAWRHQVGQGRVVVSAMGHQPDTYRLPEYQQMIGKAIGWAIGGEMNAKNAPQVPAE